MAPWVRNLARSAMLLGVVLVGLCLLAAALVRLPSMQRWVAARILERLPPGVTIERAHLTLLPPAVQLENVAFAADGPRLQSVSAQLDVPALLTGRIQLARAEISGATLVIQHAADGAVRAAGPLAPLLSASSGADQTSSAARTLAVLPEVTFTNASISLVDDAVRGGPRTLRLTGIHGALGALGADSVPFTVAAQFDPAGAVTAQGTLRQGGAAGSAAERTIDVVITASGLDADTVVSYLAVAAPGTSEARAEGVFDATATLSGSLDGDLAGDATLTQSTGSIAWDQVHLTAPLNVSAHVGATPGGVALSDGQLHVTALTAARIDAADISAAFAYDARTLHLLATRASMYGGTWSQTGTVTMTDPPTFNLVLRADGLGCETLLTAITGEHPQYGCDTLSAHADVRGAWSGAKSVARDVAGNGRIELHGGTIPSSSIIGAICDALVPLVHANVRKAIGAPTRVDHVTQSFTLQDGRMRTSDLAVVTDDFTLTGAGSIGLNGALDLNTKIAMTAAGMTKLLTMGSLPIPGEPLRLPSIPTRITGTLGDPIVRPEVQDLPVAAVKGLFRGAFGVGKALQGAAGSGLRALEDVW